jgi:hypothetical protein
MQTVTNTMISYSAPVTTERAALDLAGHQIQDGRIAFALDALFEDLRARREEEPGVWPEYARACLSHPVRNLLHQDPFTYRAFSKPRGYAGDAVMMDYIYGMGGAVETAREATPLGRAIFEYIATHPSAQAVRYRRELIASMVDQVAKNGGTRVLALAAGHLREAELSRAVRGGALEEYVAFDQDEKSLAVVDRDYERFGVRARQGSVRHILAGKVNPEQFDFVYAAGLFDYLNEPVAKSLTRRMFEITNPGGWMLIPNFLGTIPERGYMESFMDWHLIYRDHADMRALAGALPANEVAGYRIFDDPVDAITYLLVTKTA